MVEVTKEKAKEIAKTIPKTPGVAKQETKQGLVQAKEYQRKVDDKEFLLDMKDIDIILQSISKVVVFNLAQPLIEKIGLQANKQFKSVQ